MFHPSCLRHGLNLNWKLKFELSQRAQQIFHWGEMYLVVDAFDFVQQRLGPKHFGVVLFEVDALVVKRLEVILLVLLPPDLVEASLGFPPLLLLGL